MKFTYPLITLLPLASRVAAYGVDPASCGEHTAFIQGAMAQAVELARQAALALNTSPMNQDVQRIANMIFAKPGNSISGDQIASLIHDYNGIVSMHNYRQDLPIRNLYDVMIYCNVDRIQERPDGKLIDTATGTIVDADQRRRIDACTTSDASAYVWIPLADDEGNPDGGQFASQLTICPWFLEQALEAGYKTWQDVKMRSLVGKLKVAIGTPSTREFTDMDALALLDVVMLHELTHTSAGGNSYDSDLSFFRVSGGRAGRAYGWSGIKALAGLNSGLHTYRTIENADSLAYFANAVRLLGENPPLYLKSNGYLTESRQTKRDIDSFLDADSSVDGFVTYNATSTPQDGFVTIVKGSTATP